MKKELPKKSSLLSLLIVKLYPLMLVSLIYFILITFFESTLPDILHLNYNEIISMGNVIYITIKLFIIFYLCLFIFKIRQNTKNYHFK